MSPFQPVPVTQQVISLTHTHTFSLPPLPFSSSSPSSEAPITDREDSLGEIPKLFHFMVLININTTSPFVINFKNPSQTGKIRRKLPSPAKQWVWRGAIRQREMEGTGFSLYAIQMVRGSAQTRNPGSAWTLPGSPLGSSMGTSDRIQMLIGSVNGGSRLDNSIHHLPPGSSVRWSHF